MSVGAAVPLERAKVTEEFSKVLAHVYKRSLSSGDTSPYQRQIEAVSDLEVVETIIPPVSPNEEQNENQDIVPMPPYYRNEVIAPGKSQENIIVNKISPDDAPFNKSSPESDSYNYGLSTSTGTSTMGTLPRPKQKAKKKSGHAADYSSDGALSEDEEQGKKKKSLFKKAKERVRESLRKSRGRREKSVESEGESSRENTFRKPKRKMKCKPRETQSVNGTVKTEPAHYVPQVNRSSSEKSKSDHADKSPGKDSDGNGSVISQIHTHAHTHVEHFSGAGDIGGNGACLHVERTHQWSDFLTDDSPNKHIDVNYKLMESYPVPKKAKEEKEHHLIEALRRILKRSSLHKNDKKHRKEHKRSRSADSIRVHGVQPEIHRTTISRSNQPDKAVTKVEHRSIKPAIPLLGRGPGGRLSQHADTEEALLNGEIETTFKAAGDIDRSRAVSLPRTHLNLAGIQPHRPNLPAGVPTYSVDYEHDRVDTITKTASGHFKFDTTSSEHQSTLVPDVVLSSEPDSIDGGTGRLELGLSDSSVQELGSKPFKDRTDVEKEKMYGIIAEKLNLIADHYLHNQGSSVDGTASPLSPRGRSREASPKSPEESIDDVDAIKQELAKCLRIKGDTINEQLPETTTSELAVGLTYGEFRRVVDSHTHNKPSVQQLATLVLVSKSIVGLVGAGGAMAQNTKEMTLRYFEDKFASWIFNRGGWESVVEDIDSSQYTSEVD